MNFSYFLSRARWVQTLMRAGWPAVIGLAACVLGLLMLGVSWYIQSTAIQISAASEVAKSAFASNVEKQDKSSRPMDWGQSDKVPLESTYFSDLSSLFGMAKSMGLTSPAVEYRTEKPFATLPITVHTLDFRISDEYPKVKRFVAAVLAEMAHVALQEIRIDRQEAGANQVQIFLKLSFVYRNESETAQQPILSK